ncbi:MAG: hypothetical protein NT069_10575, partial [Planctomycetota bacterium]|nr:hypothetical protein [Planctomycetota bacterium]
MKSRHQSRTARGASRTLQPVPVIVDGLLKQGRYKEALSQSLNAFRSDPTTEHRQTTERAYLRYVADLVRSGALTAATEVAKRFLEFGCSGVESLEALLPLLAAIKLTTESANLIEKIQSPEKITALKANMADQAVRLGRDQDWPFPEIRPGAAAVTAAMEA